jgi:hypothetical protein
MLKNFENRYTSYRDFNIEELKERNIHEIDIFIYQDILSESMEFIRTGTERKVYSLKFDSNYNVISEEYDNYEFVNYEEFYEYHEFDKYVEMKYKYNIANQIIEINTYDCNSSLSNYKYFTYENGLLKSTYEIKYTDNYVDTIICKFGNFNNLVYSESNLYRNIYTYNNQKQLVHVANIYKKSNSNFVEDSTLCNYQYDSLGRIVSIVKFPSPTFFETTNRWCKSGLYSNQYFKYPNSKDLLISYDKEFNSFDKYTLIDENYLTFEHSSGKSHLYQMREGTCKVIVRNSFYEAIEFIDIESTLPSKINEWYNHRIIRFTYQ